MAYLIERSGERGLAARIAASRNLARVRNLAGDAELLAWLGRNGLTLAEAARIQPEYGEAEKTEETVSIAVAVIGAGIGLGGIALNRSPAETLNSRNTRGLLGIVFGLIGAGLGVPSVGADDGVVRAIGVVDIGVGLVSAGLGVRQLNARPTSQAMKDSPVIRPGWRLDGDGAPQLAVIVSF